MNARDFRCSVKLVVVPANAEDRGAALGKGVVSLCRGVQELGSLNKAAKRMGMSYSKAWRIMKEAEEAFGVELLDRNGPKGSDLTADAVRLIKAYDAAEEAARAAADAALEEWL